MGLTGRQVLGLSAVLALLGVAVFVGQSTSGGPDVDPQAQTTPAVSDRVARLQEEAAQIPCPTGLGPALPEVTLRCLGGGPAVQVDAAGPELPTVLNVWGSWCGPCRREVPDLVRFADAASGVVSLVGVDTADDDASALSFAIEMDMRYPSLVDTDAAINAAFGSGVPKTILLAPGGEVVHVARGEVTYDVLVGLVAEHLGVTV